MLFLPISLLRDGRSAQPKRSSRPCRRKTRQRPGLLLLRRLPLGLRSHRRPGPPHPRRCPRRCKPKTAHTVTYLAQTLCRPSTSPSTNIARPSAPMPGANPSATPSTGPRLPLPARPPTRPVRIPQPQPEIWTTMHSTSTTLAASSSTGNLLESTLTHRPQLLILNHLHQR